MRKLINGIFIQRYESGSCKKISPRYEIKELSYLNILKTKKKYGIFYRNTTKFFTLICRVELVKGMYFTFCELTSNPCTFESRTKLPFRRAHIKQYEIRSLAVRGISRQNCMKMEPVFRKRTCSFVLGIP